MKYKRTTKAAISFFLRVTWE